MAKLVIEFDLDSLNQDKKIQPQISKLLRTIASQLREFGMPKNSPITDDDARTIGRIYHA